MVPGYQKLGKLTGSPSGTTVVGLVPSQVVACLCWERALVDHADIPLVIQGDLPLLHYFP